MTDPDFEYTEVRECVFKNERYSVRDNGAIMRHPNNFRKRPADSKWTFGTKNANGYMVFCHERVHIIVATAFHGAHDSKVLVVDHIDTNRSNNRPENLRWLTKLENILLNEFTRAKVEYICGSIDNFLKDPSLLYNHESEDPNFTWMRTVTKEEAARTLEHLKELGERKPVDKIEFPSGAKMAPWEYESYKERKRKSLQKAMTFTNEDFRHISEEDEKKRNTAEEERNRPRPTENPLAYFIGWNRPPVFPLCPESVGNDPINDYLSKIKEGSVIISAHYGDSLVYKYIRHEYQILVVTKKIGVVKPWGLLRIKWDNNCFIHESIGTYFEENGALAVYTIEQGLVWDGPDSIDFYCD